VLESGSELEEELARWRRAWAAHLPPDRADVLDELEGHLRDAVRDATARGADAAGALADAVARLGAADELARELAKVPRDESGWWPARAVECVVAAGAAAVLCTFAPRLLDGGLATLFAAHVGLVSVGYLAAAGAGALAAAYLVARLLRDPLPGQKRALRRLCGRLCAWATAATLSGVALGLLCPFAKAGPVLGLSPHEVGGLGILVASASALAGLRRARPTANLERRMLLGLAAGLAVVVGWLGAGLVGAAETGAHELALFSALVGAHLVLAAAAFAPANWLQRSA
jgi:hypothetical protein